jgi:hypothetical protein
MQAGVRARPVRPGPVMAGTVMAVLAIGAVLLAGCGSSASSSAPSRTPDAAAAQMQAAVKDARSVHLDGSLRSGGKPVALNLGLIRSGGFSGTITDNGVPLTLTDTGQKVYVKATPAFLRELHASSSLCTLLCGKYIEMTPAQGGALAGNLTMSRLLASLTGPLPKFSNAGTATVGGRQAQVLRASDGSTLDVAATGTAYPLRVTGKNSAGRLDFTQWNAVRRPAAPPASQVVSLSRLGAR